MPEENLLSHFYVLPENWDAVRFFLRLQTQWALDDKRRPVGLSYSAVESLFSILNVSDRETLFQQLQVMEWAALGEIYERQ